jgi:hypothetical protein
MPFATANCVSHSTRHISLSAAVTETLILRVAGDKEHQIFLPVFGLSRSHLSPIYEFMTNVSTSLWSRQKMALTSLPHKYTMHRGRELFYLTTPKENGNEQSKTRSIDSYK